VGSTKENSKRREGTQGPTGAGRDKGAWPIPKLWERGWTRGGDVEEAAIASSADERGEMGNSPTSCFFHLLISHTIA
jgi:predicted NUDIX family NTP pyrophosphohydrolase